MYDGHKTIAVLFWWTWPFWSNLWNKASETKTKCIFVCSMMLLTYSGGIHYGVHVFRVTPSVSAENKTRQSHIKGMFSLMNTLILIVSWVINNTYIVGQLPFSLSYEFIFVNWLIEIIRNCNSFILKQFDTLYFLMCLHICACPKPG